MATVRHALFAEAGVKMLQVPEQLASTPVSSDMGMREQADALRAKLAGQQEVARLRPILYPEDD